MILSKLVAKTGFSFFVSALVERGCRFASRGSNPLGAISIYDLRFATCPTLRLLENPASDGTDCRFPLFAVPVLVCSLIDSHFLPAFF